MQLDYSDWQTNDLHSPSEHVKKKLNQIFTFYKTGGQSYIFLGEDNQTILKFIKLHHFRLPPFYSLTRGAKKAKIKENRRSKRHYDTLTSLKIGYEHLKDDTAQIYAHLAPTKILSKKLKIRDPSGVLHLIDLNRMPFVLQQKAELLTTSLERLPKKKYLLKEIESLFQKIANLGIIDDDINFTTNFGVYKNKPILIDTGRLRLVHETKTFSTVRYKRIRKDFSKWLKVRYPELLTQLNHEIPKTDTSYL